MQHQLETNCIRKDCGGTCFGCNIPVCKLCKLFEGALTTDCPGAIVSWEEQDRIYKDGNLDFRGEAWVNEPNPHNQDVAKWAKQGKVIA